MCGIQEARVEARTKHRLLVEKCRGKEIQNKDIIRNINIKKTVNPLNAELNLICYLLALLGAHHFLHVSRIRVKSLTLRLLMSHIYIYIYI